MRRAAIGAAIVCALTACTDAATPRTPASEGGTPAPRVSAAMTWQRLASAPSARTEVAAAVAGTRVYVVGGFRADGGTLATVEIFDTATGRWEPGPDLPVAVNHAMAATVGDAVYVFGGYLDNRDASAAAFRFEAGGWRAVAPMPQGRGAGTAVTQDGKVYVAGDRWSTAPGPPTPREHLGGAGFGGKVYTVGGRAGGQGNFAAFEVFDPATGRWVKLPDLPTRRGGLAAAATCSGRIVAVGGEAEATFSEAEVFDVRTASWQALPPLPTPRHGLGVVALGTTLYTFAGGPRPGLHVADTTEAIDLASLEDC